ncbi:MAG: GAF domain-containing protein, partial [Chloroflexi bacterium]|nr:GAF domain-containing protein [Chloroflexota bacterium]
MEPTDREDSRIRIFRALHEIAVAVCGVLEPVELARVVVNHTRELFQAGAVGLYTFDEAERLLRPVYSSDAREGSLEPPIPPGTGAAGQALERGAPVRIDDYPNWPFAGGWTAANGVQSAMGVPLLVADRRTGAISVRTYEPRHWTEDDAQALTLLAAQVAPALEAARLHERTQTARQQAEAAIKLRDEVLAGVSHDLAGPLSRIRLYAELMQGEAPTLQPTASAQQMTAWSSGIIAATASMRSIIQELLDVARLQMGQALSLNLQRTDLVALCRRAVQEYQHAGRRVSLRTAQDMLVGWWDEARLARVLANLLENATKYSPPESEVLVHVDVAEYEAGGWAILRVRDAGRGIPPDNLPHVFERFYRGSNV